MRSRLVALACAMLIIASVSAKAKGGGGLARGGGGLARGAGGHSYPASTGYSGSRQTHTYPHSTGGSGHGTYNRDAAYGNNFKHSRTDVHHHYHYSPPQQIQYGNARYPTYHGAPPTYVYNYRQSGSRFDTLLTGLALYNLAMMSTHHGNSYGHGWNEHRPAGEQCKLGVRRDTGEYEENRVDCRLLTSMMLDADTQTNSVTKTVTNVVYVADEAPNTNGSHNETTVTTEAVSVKGPSIKVTPSMQCYLIHTTYNTSRKKIVPCGLLQSYAVNSMRRNADVIRLPSMGLVAFVCLCLVF